MTCSILPPFSKVPLPESYCSYLHTAFKWSILCLLAATPHKSVITLAIHWTKVFCIDLQHIDPHWHAALNFSIRTLPAAYCPQLFQYCSFALWNMSIWPCSTEIGWKEVWSQLEFLSCHFLSFYLIVVTILVFEMSQFFCFTKAMSFKKVT